MNEPQISEFSVAFARHLRGVMAERKIKLRDLAGDMDRSIGFVSERTGGVRPVDTDILDAVARLAGMDPRSLVAQIAGRLQWDQVNEATDHPAGSNVVTLPVGDRSEGPSSLEHLHDEPSAAEPVREDPEGDQEPEHP